MRLISSPRSRTWSCRTYTTPFSVLDWARPMSTFIVTIAQGKTRTVLSRSIVRGGSPASSTSPPISTFYWWDTPSSPPTDVLGISSGHSNAMPYRHCQILHLDFRVSMANRFELLQGEQKRHEVIYMGDSIVRKIDRTVCRGRKEKTTTVCLPGARVDDVRKRVGQVMGPGTGGSICVHVGTNDADKEGTTAIVGKFRQNKNRLVP